jgi:YYY domain-containing protein
MTSFILWYFTFLLLGIMTFPLAYRLFPVLADRGYVLSRALGLLLWGFIFWLLASLGIVQNNTAGILTALVILLGLSIWALYRPSEGAGLKDQNMLSSSLMDSSRSVIDWVKINWKLVLTTEVLFLAAFSFMALVRAANPEALGTEKPMELAFINAIIHSPTFPPHDPWLSGYSISYYYFGYVMTGLLAKITATSGGVAFNLMLALMFGLDAIGSFGVVFNLLEAYKSGRLKENLDAAAGGIRSIAGALLAPIFLLLAGNFEGFLEILHRLGIFWPKSPSAFNFWTWLDIKDLREAPLPPFTINPAHLNYYWWWRASRVVQEYKLNGAETEIIDEFPAFSYILGDLHPHILAMPFALLIIAGALNLFLGGWKGSIDLKLVRPRISWRGFLASAILLGGIAFLNTWDFPIYFALYCGAFLLARVHESGWARERWWEFFELAIPLGLASILFYLPFYLGFSSQAGGIIPTLINPIRGAHLWVMFGPLLIFLFAYLVYLWRVEKLGANWKTAFLLIGGLVIGMWGIAWILVFVANSISPDRVAELINLLGVDNVGAAFSGGLSRRISFIGGLITLVLLLVGSLALLLARKEEQGFVEVGEVAPSISLPSTSSFVLLLILIGALLVLAPDFFYLRDQFGWRMNTIFKFYYQAWLLWSVVAAFAVVVILNGLRGFTRSLFSATFIGVLMMALVYSPLGYISKTNGFNPPQGFSLDAAGYMQGDDAVAIKWLSQAAPGVVAEAVGINGAQYSEYARIATLSGQPNVLGWGGHESQWRGGNAEMGTRENDIRRLYESRNWDEARAIIEQYDIKYIYFGNLERSRYNTYEEKFKLFLPVAFQQGSVTIYIAP